MNYATKLDIQNGEIQVSRNPGKDEVAAEATDVGRYMAKTKTANNTAKRKTSRKDRMLANPDIRRWYDNLARGSPITAETRVRRLDKFCEMHHISPMDLADLGMRDPRTATDLLEYHITAMEEKGYSPGYIEDHIKAVKSWLRHFDVDIRRKLKISNPDHTPTLQDERVPDGQEMSEVFARASLRTAAMISLMAKSGLRPEVMGNHDGTDGLRMSDLPDMVIQQGVVRCISNPCRVVVRRELSKTRHQYFTFLTSSGAKCLTAYLNDRLAFGEPLHGKSPVIAPDYRHKTGRGRNADRPCLQTRQVSREIRNALRPRFAWRPYVLRAYFDTQLLIAESKGRMAHDFRVFFMGHKGSMEAKYTTNKGVLPEALVAEMRSAFTRSEDLLDLEASASQDPVLDQKQDIREAVQDATPEEAGLVLEVLQKMGIGKTGSPRG